MDFTTFEVISHDTETIKQDRFLANLKTIATYEQRNKYRYVHVRMPLNTAMKHMPRALIDRIKVTTRKRAYDFLLCNIESLLAGGMVNFEQDRAMPSAECSAMHDYNVNTGCFKKVRRKEQDKYNPWPPYE